ncbi:MAG: NAD(P)-dependent oxidoreductase, partial [Dehalococcoidia bacterium]
GAAFDVYETWPVRADSPLLELDNVVLTPHIGGATDGTVARHSQMIADDVERFLRGERPKNLVNPQVWDDNV